MQSTCPSDVVRFTSPHGTTSAGSGHAQPSFGLSHDVPGGTVIVGPGEACGLSVPHAMRRPTAEAMGAIT